MVLDTVASPNSRRNYGKALDDLFALAGGRPLTPALFMEYRASMEALSPSTTNVRLSAVRKLVAEARQKRHDWSRRRREARGGPEHPAEGNSPGELAHPRAGQGAAGRARPVDTERQARLRDPGAAGRLRPSPAGAGLARCRDDPVAGGPLGARGSRREGKAGPDGRGPGMGQAGNQLLDERRRNRGRPAAAVDLEGRKDRRHLERLGGLVGRRADRRRRSGSSASGPTTCAGPARSSAGRRAATSSRSSFCWATRRSRRPSATWDRNRRSQLR